MIYYKSSDHGVTYVITYVHSTYIYMEEDLSKKNYNTLYVLPNLRLIVSFLNNFVKSHDQSND